MMNYLYNGVELPKLPEVDTTTFPNDVYTLICERSVDDSTNEYVVWMLNGIPRYSDDKIKFPILNTVYENYTCQVSDGVISEWVKANEGIHEPSDDYICLMQDDGVHGINYHLIYTDFDVTDNGTVIFEASEPTTIKYLYNTVELPDISNLWLAPCRIIYFSQGKCFLILCRTAEYMTDGTIRISTSHQSYYYHDDEWVLGYDKIDNYDPSEVYGIGNDCTIIWTYTDICDVSTGAVRYAASTAVRVGTKMPDPVHYCVYNGVVLPDIDAVLDKTTYPYVGIYKYNDYVHSIVQSTKPLIMGNGTDANGETGYGIICGVESTLINVPMYFERTKYFQEVGSARTLYPYEGVDIGSAFYWANYDVYDKEGELVLSESDSEPVVNYKYNDVELPNINEVWTDKETYPYAVIVKQQESGNGEIQFTLLLLPTYKFNVVEQGGVKKLYLEETANCASFLQESDTWVSDGVAEYDFVANADSLVWASSTLIAGGELHILTSEPIPVGSEPVQPEDPEEPETQTTDYAIIPMDDYKAACDAIRAKSGKTGLIKSGNMAAEITDIETGTNTSHDTVSPTSMLKGVTAHDASGNPIVGTIETYDASTEASNAIFQEKTVISNGEVTADEGYVGLSKVVVDVPTSGGGDNSMFNIHYGLTPPEDTSKLWVKTDKQPVNTDVSMNFTHKHSLDILVNTLPIATSGIATAVVGSKIYLFGGGGMSYSDNNLNTIQVYDTTTNELSTLDTVLPNKATQITPVVVGDKIYLFGGVGTSALDTINIFDTTNNQIETLDVKLPQDAWAMSGGLVGNKIYLIGGCYSNGTDYRTRIDAFDLTTHTFAKLGSTLTLYNAATEVVGNKIYLFGGRTNYRGGGSSSITCFDTTTDTVTTLDSKLTISGYGMSSVRLGTKVYVFGGMTYSNMYGASYLKNICEFDIETEESSTLGVSLPVSTVAIGAAIVGTKAYLFGGHNSDEYLSTINVFNITSDLTSGRIRIIPSLAKNKFMMINGNNFIQLGVEEVFIGNDNNEAERVDAYLTKYAENEIVSKQFTHSQFEVESATTLTASVQCQSGDLIVASIITRDALTLSEGWTLISTSLTNSNDTAGNGQRLSFAYKYAESTAESITVTQATEQRLYINLVSLKGATGVIDNGYHYDNNDTSSTQSITVTKPSGLVLWACSAAIWDTNSLHNIWEVSNGAYIVQLGETAQSRLGTVLDQTEEETVTFTAGASGTTLIVGSLTISGMDKFYDVFTGYTWLPI